MGDALVLAAGDERLAAADAVEDELLAGGVELGENIVEQEDGIFARLGKEKIPLRELEGEGGRARLALGGKAPGGGAVDGDVQIVLVRAREAEAGFDLGAAVRLLMVAEGVIDLLFGGEGVLYSADGLLFHRKLFV